MSESKLQSKILEWLRKNNFWAIKVVVCNKNGVPDIVACSPKGRLIGIEVKYGDNVASPLQKYNIREINKRGGLGFVAWDLNTVIEKLQGELSTNTAKPSE